MTKFVLQATVLLIPLVASLSHEGNCDFPSDQACPSAGEGISLLQVKANKLKQAVTGRSANGKGRVFARIEKVDSIKANSSSKDCSCTWDAKYPCSLEGYCYSYSTKASCEGAGGQFCNSSGGGDGSSGVDDSGDDDDSAGGEGNATDEGAGDDDDDYGGRGEGNATDEGAGDDDDYGAGGEGNATDDGAGGEGEGGGGECSTKGWEKAVLEETNKYRALHHAPALTWDDALAKKAQSWADTCDFIHSTMDTGENLWCGTGCFNGSSAVTDWYSEIKDYNFAKPGFGMSTGHFTQLVWKSTTKVGCGLKKCGYLKDAGFSDAYYLVCEYSPAGNYDGEYTANVLP